MCMCLCITNTLAEITRIIHLRITTYQILTVEKKTTILRMMTMTKKGIEKEKKERK